MVSSSKAMMLLLACPACLANVGNGIYGMGSGASATVQAYYAARERETPAHHQSQTLQTADNGAGGITAADWGAGVDYYDYDQDSSQQSTSGSASAPSAIGRLINAGSGAMQLQSSSNGQQSSSFPIASTATGSVSFNGQYQQGSNSLIDAVAAKLGLPASTVQEIRVYFGEGPQQKPRLRGGKVFCDAFETNGALEQHNNCD